MKILPVNNSNNQISHKAVNKKFLDKAINTYLRYKPYHNQLPLVNNIANQVYYGLISYRDAIDTLEAIKPISQNAASSIDDLIKNLKEALSNQ